VTLPAALFSLALLARAAPFEAKPGTVRFVRIANSAFDRCTKRPTPSEQAWMRAVGVDRAERLCPRRGGGVGDARADHRYGMADRACPVAAPVADLHFVGLGIGGFSDLNTWATRGRFEHFAVHDTYL